MLTHVSTSFLPVPGLCNVGGQVSTAVTGGPPHSPDSGWLRGVARVEIDPEHSVAAPIQPGFLPHSGNTGDGTHQRNAFCLKYSLQF